MEASKAGKFGAAGGFAIGLGVALASGSRPETALLRGVVLAAIATAVGIFLAALNSSPRSADETSGSENHGE